MSPDPPCYFCNVEGDEGDFCTGCGHYICDECSTSDPPFGDHDVDDHQLAEQDNDFDELDFN